MFQSPYFFMPIVNPTIPSSSGNSVTPFAFLIQAFAWMGQNWIIIGAGLLVSFGLYAFWRIYVKQKEEDDIFLRDYKRTKEMCKLQRNRKRIRSSPIPIYIFGVFFFIGIAMLIIGFAMNWGNFLMWSFGIFGIGLFISGGLQWIGFFKRRDRVYMTSGISSKFLGFYGGECVTENMKNYLIEKGLGPMKKQFIVRINLNRKVTVVVPVNRQIKKGEETTTKKPTKKKKADETEVGIAFPEHPVIEGEDSIIIKGMGLQQYRYFLYPILFDQFGNPISMKFIATSLEKGIALVDTLYDQTSDFARIMREQVNLNPDVRYRQKVGGQSSAVD